MKHTNHLRIALAAVAGIAVLGLLGVPVGRYVPYALVLLVCPLMMFVMMRGMAQRDAPGHQTQPADRDDAEVPSAR